MRCAAMAQRKGELLKLETLERVAALLPDLRDLAARAGLPTDAARAATPKQPAADSNGRSSSSRGAVSDASMRDLF